MPMLNDPCLPDMQRKLAAQLCVQVGVLAYRQYPASMSDYLHTLLEHGAWGCRQKGWAQRQGL